MNFPQKLQEYRRTAKISQEELANRLGVSRQSVSKWEQGLSFPETEKLIELSTMMGQSIDSLLKDTSCAQDTSQPPEPSEAPASEKPAVDWERWVAIGLVILLAAVALASVLPNTPYPNGNSFSPETTAPQTDTTSPVESTELTPPSETASGGSDFLSKDLQHLQSWFFDFARDYRLDYMPQFTSKEGAPTDSGAYLYWAFAISLDNRGADKDTMSKSYVDETVWQYFRVTPELHRSHHKQWNYDEATETYTPWPEGLRSLPYYLLNSIAVDNGVYTVHATCYSAPTYMEPGEEDDRLRQTLLEGNNTELTAVAEVTLTFHLEYFSFYEPLFYSFTVAEIEPS